MDGRSILDDHHRKGSLDAADSTTDEQKKRVQQMAFEKEMESYKEQKPVNFTEFNKCVLKRTKIE